MSYYNTTFTGSQAAVAAAVAAAVVAAVVAVAPVSLLVHGHSSHLLSLYLPEQTVSYICKYLPVRGSEQVSGSAPQ